MEEYRQHFAFKLAEGHTEEEIAAKLGEPEAIAAQYDAVVLKGKGGHRAAALVGLGLFRSFGPELLLRSLNYERNCRAVKSRFATAHSWYCLCLAVSPQLQGRGIASRLIRPALEELEANRCSLYLETHRELNVSIYRHLGFELLDASPIPGTNIVQYSMMKG